jgi:hypothetical protein
MRSLEASMPFRPFTRCALTLATILTFGCATVRAPASSIDGEVTVGPNGPEPEVELWLESGAPVSEAEKAKAVAQVRRALDEATATLVSDDGEALLVVRAQGISRTGSRRADQQAAKVGIAVGAVAIVALAVIALVAGKGHGGGGGGGGRVKAVPARAPRGSVRPHAARPHFRVPSATGHGHVHGGVALNLVVPVPSEPRRAGEPELVGVRELPPAEQEVQPVEPVQEKMVLQLPPPRPLDTAGRKFFDKDFTRLELLVVDRATGRATWVKTVEGPVDPRDPAAVKGLLAAGLQEDAGWTRME